ncbi:MULTISPECIES: molybdenum cofactor guanylyltransferase [unclassified Bacillus (in: firmicutes)]|uniref:molybdenum cofactor guanylyltransferase n=1 Tax=unclassified Bacillus (in: firmicutes) TaxID=185979 RepID=UPI0008EEF6C2|nr:MULTISPECIES: molybdenum cofactor guanylyltransferase [unclassified Bacillus (in: firmicutes)]SFJ97890.1 molybdenum cofactor guanylyltransferase [Bacillus sp. 71mf]SFT17231.1 molybdenum cofactor guanylyltransferase [Bacillus sp. 103mf]
MKIAGIVLAGGRSSRFGEPKALATWQGKTFIEHSIEALKEVVTDMVVISHSDITDELSHILNVPVIEDLALYKGNGPLAGLVTGMEYVSADWYIVAPCDTPNVSKEWALELIERADEVYEAIVPLAEGRKQPLLALYHYKVKEKIERLLKEEKRSMQGLLSQCNVQYVTVTETDVFVNVNTKEEYNELQKKKSK